MFTAVIAVSYSFIILPNSAFLLIMHARQLLASPHTLAYVPFYYCISGRKCPHSAIPCEVWLNGPLA